MARTVINSDSEDDVPTPPKVIEKKQIPNHEKPVHAQPSNTGVSSSKPLPKPSIPVKDKVNTNKETSISKKSSVSQPVPMKRIQQNNDKSENSSVSSKSSTVKSVSHSSDSSRLSSSSSSSSRLPPKPMNKIQVTNKPKSVPKLRLETSPKKPIRTQNTVRVKPVSESSSEAEFDIDGSDDDDIFSVDSKKSKNVTEQKVLTNEDLKILDKEFIENDIIQGKSKEKTKEKSKEKPKSSTTQRASSSSNKNNNNNNNNNIKTKTKTAAKKSPKEDIDTDDSEDDEINHGFSSGKEDIDFGNDDEYTIVKGATYQPRMYIFNKKDVYKTQMVTRILVRWNYCMEWKLLSDKCPGKEYMELVGFPGVYIGVHGGVTGLLVDNRDPSTAPSIDNLIHMDCMKLKELWIKGCENQIKDLIEAEGTDAITLPSLESELRQAREVDADFGNKQWSKIKGTNFAPLFA
ncbi:hypothetical protein WA158_003639 [Blastocystis sp. Blastoise]